MALSKARYMCNRNFIVFHRVLRELVVAVEKTKTLFFVVILLNFDLYASSNVHFPLAAVWETERAHHDGSHDAREQR